MGKRERRTFTEEFKQEAVRLTETSGRTISQVSDDLGVGLSTLTRWKRQFRETDLLAGPHEDTAKETLQQAIRADGFISGESLRDMENPRHRIVLCKWRSQPDWDRWFHSMERKEMMNKLSLMLEGGERITILDAP